TAVFLGDLVDRGPDTPGVLSMVMRMTAAGHALAVAGNHEAKLLRALRGRDVSLSHGLAGSLGQIEAREAEQPGFRAAAERLLDAELLPWSAKADDLVRVQYATVGLRGLVQPGLKVRGRDYLRIIYRPDYTDAANLDRLRARGLGVKRSLAAREYALGLEGLG